MFTSKLSDVRSSEIQNLIDSEVPEGLDLEFKRSLSAKSGADAWMTGGRIGDEAKDHLTKEIIAFANTDGGTLILGLDEDKVSKRAIGPLYPIPRCKDAANSLLQSIGQRIEPRLPSFECEGVITEDDGESGVVIMRTLPSYLAPHRHTQDRHCYVRRNDASEPMSMSEIQEMTKRVSKGLDRIDEAFSTSAGRFRQWIPSEFRHHDQNHLTSSNRMPIDGDEDTWVGSWGIRVTAKPLSSIPATNLVHGDKGKLLEFPILRGRGRQGMLQMGDLRTVRIWQQRLRACERGFEGVNFNGLDRLSTDGQIDRFLFSIYPEKEKPRYMWFSINELVWNVASVMWFAHVIRLKASRPSLSFAMEVELLCSNALRISPYAGPTPAGAPIVPQGVTVFPRYEVGALDEFDSVLTTFDQDVWNLAAFHPDWALSVDWPSVP